MVGNNILNFSKNRYIYIYIYIYIPEPSHGRLLLERFRSVYVVWSVWNVLAILFFNRLHSWSSFWSWVVGLDFQNCSGWLTITHRSSAMLFACGWRCYPLSGHVRCAVARVSSQRIATLIASKSDQNWSTSHVRNRRFINRHVGDATCQTRFRRFPTLPLNDVFYTDYCHIMPNMILAVIIGQVLKMGNK